MKCYEAIIQFNGRELCYVSRGEAYHTGENGSAYPVLGMTSSSLGEFFSLSQHLNYDFISSLCAEFIGEINILKNCILFMGIQTPGKALVDVS